MQSWACLQSRCSAACKHLKPILVSVLQDYVDDHSEKREQLPRWALSCQREGELERICKQYHDLAEATASSLQQVLPG